MSFTSELRAFRNKSTAKVIKVKRLASFELFAAVIVATPVDKGVLRNNWFVQMSRGSTERTEDTDVSGQSTVDRTRARLVATNLREDIYFTNNLPYASVVEYGDYPPNGPKTTSDGFSRKASKGMVRVNALRWDKIVKSVARKVASE